MLSKGNLRRMLTDISYGLGLLVVLGYGAQAWAFPGEIPFENQPPPPPPGTVINHANWGQYKDYMTVGEQLLWEGKMYWKYAPDAQWKVVATRPLLDPPYYQVNTAKYSGQVRLVKQPNGGTLLENYAAGRPFPQVTEPDAGYKVLWNDYFSYEPYTHFSSPVPGYLIDRFGNSYYQVVISHIFRLAHVSDPVQPQTLPEATGFEETDEVEIVEPENAKYLTQLTAFYQDETKLEALWSFIPSLRRVLRNSSNSRCAQSFGDFAREDLRGGFTGGVPRFIVKLKAHKKMLVQTRVKGLKSNVPTAQEIDEWGMVKYAMNPPGEWEVQPAYVIELMPVPEWAPGYCYKPKVLYVLDSTFSIMGVANYDSAGKLWRVQLRGENPIPDGYGNYYIESSPDNWFEWLDVQNQHITQLPTRVGDSYMHASNTLVPLQFRNPQRYGLPSGLAMIMQ